MLTLSVVEERAMRSFQRAPLTIWPFQRMFQNVPALKGAAVQSVSAFIQTLSKLGKLIEVRKRSEKDETKTKN